MIISILNFKGWDMSFFKDLKTSDKVLFILFVLTFIIFICFHYHYKEGLFFDQPAMFSAVICRQNENLSGYFLFFDNRIRFFNNLLVSIPFNILLCMYRLIINKVSILNYLCLFTSSYFIIQLLALILNFIVAARTKRYDIAITGFAFYTFFCLPNAIWAVREINITVLFYFMLLSYFLSKEKLGKKDFIPVVLILIYLFEAFEQTVFFAIVLNIFACLYTVYKKDENLGYKNLIGLGTFFASVYIIVKLFLWIPDAIGGGIEQYIFGIIFYTKNILHTGGIITLAGIIPLLIIIFYKKKFNKFISIPIIIYTIIVYLLTWKINGFTVDAAVELNAYGWVILFIFPVLSGILLLDYLNIDITKKNPEFFNRLLTIGLIIGISQLFWQIHSAYNFGNYVTYIKDKVNNSKEKLIEISEEEYNTNPDLKYYLTYGIVHQSVLLSNSNEVKSIIIPFKFKHEEEDWNSEQRTYYDDKEKLSRLHDAIYLDKHKKYIDVSSIVKYIEEQRNNN